MTRLFALAIALVLAACSAPGATTNDRRGSVDARTSEVLVRLYEEAPSARKQIQSAAGYAVFSNVGVDVFLVGAAGGYGVAVNNASGVRTYMRVGEAGVGFGLGVKDFRVVFVFQSAERLKTFVEEGWDLGIDANATAELGGEGASVGGAASFVDGVAIYQLTENGLALRANLKGTKYWPYAELNR
ncbi:MAG: YSC84-related protein [Planctomycetota bacterium]